MAFSSEKVILPESREKCAQISMIYKQKQFKTIQNKYVGGF